MARTSKYVQNWTASHRCYPPGPGHHCLPLGWLARPSIWFPGSLPALQPILQRAARGVTLKLHALLLQSCKWLPFPSKFWQTASKALPNLYTVPLLRPPPTPYPSDLTSYYCCLLPKTSSRLRAIVQTVPSAEATLLPDIQMAPSPPLRLCSNATFSMKSTMNTLFKNARPPAQTLPIHLTLLSSHGT